MRPGLVVVGILLLVVAAGTLVSVYLVPLPPARQAQETTVVPTLLQPGESLTPISITGTGSAHASLVLRWQSTVPMDVGLYPATGCAQRPPTQCPPAPIVSWTLQQSGNFSSTGALAFPLTIQVGNPSNASGTFQATAVASSPVTPGLAPLASLFVDAAAGSLIAIGVVAAFLGFFLRANVYTELPPPPVSRSAEDVSDLVGGMPPSPPGERP